MGNGISLEESENKNGNGNEECSRENNNIEMKETFSETNETGETSNSISTVKRIKKASSDVSKKRRSTSKNGNSNSASDLDYTRFVYNN